MTVVADGEVACTWRYANMDDAVRGLLCSAGGARATDAAGEKRVRAVLAEAMRPFEHGGGVTMRNTFRWVAATR